MTALTLGRVPTTAVATSTVSEGPPPVAMALTIVLVLGSVLYPFALYDGDVGRSLSASGVTIFWSHAAFCAVTLLTAVALRATAFTAVQLFHWIFYVVAAREQFIHQWDGLYALTDVVERGLVYLLIYEIVIFFVYLAVTQLRRRPLPAAEVRPRRLAGARRLTVLLTTCLVVDLALLAHFGSELFANREVFAVKAAQLFPAQANLFFLQYFRPLLYFIPLFILRSQITWPRRREDPLPGALIGLALICVLLGYSFNTPFNSPRFHAGSIAVGTVMLFLGARCLSALLSIVVVGLFAAPLFHAFRNEWTREHSGTAFGELGLEQFRSFDFDALSNHLYAVYYLEKFEHFYGVNLLSGLLFFVPNEIWTGKISNSGGHVLGAVGWEFRGMFPPNSSMPLVGDGLLAFGIVGVILVAVLFAVALRLLDLAPHPARPEWTALYPRAAVLAFTPVLLFFLSRGVLVPAFAYSSGNLLAAATAAALIAQSARGARPPAPGSRGHRIGARWRGTAVAAAVDATPPRAPG